MWRDGAVVLVVAVVVAALTYVISNSVSATYRASTQVQVSVPGQNGLGQDSVLGANQLTAQLVQLAPSDAVLDGPATLLGISSSALRGALSVGAVAQQNILQISATAGSSAGAQARANAVTRAVLTYVANSSQRQLDAYARSVQGVIKGMGTALGRLSSSRGKLSPAQLGVIQGEAGAIASQDQALRGQLAQRAAASSPTVQEISAATSATKVSPRPVLYTIVAFLVVGFLGLQLVNAGAWRSRRR
jgi:hypothetical protein